MKCNYISCLIFSPLFIVACATNHKDLPPAPCVSASPVKFSEFLLGGSLNSIEFEVLEGRVSQYAQLASDLGLRGLRIQCHWRLLAPTIDLTKSDAQLISELNWEKCDEAIRQVQEKRIKVILTMGRGYVGSLPIDLKTGEAVNPSTASLGKERYITLQSLIAEAIAKRYKDKGIYLYQLENELNEAGLTTQYGWRAPKGFSAAETPWFDWDFLTNLLKGLSEAVKKADSTAIVTTNFHTDVPELFHDVYYTPNWKEALEAWRSFVDVISLDTYPNYIVSQPTQGNIVGDRVNMARSLACPGQPVMVMETGYPSDSQPLPRGYSETLQKEFIENAFASAYAAGASGFMIFGLKTEETPIVPSSQSGFQFDRNQSDVNDLIAVDGYLNQYSIDADQRTKNRIFLSLIMKQKFLQNRLPWVLKTVEPYWGLVTQAGEKKLAYGTVQQIVEKIYPKYANQFFFPIKTY